MMGRWIPLVLFIVLVYFFYNGLGRDTKKLPSPLIGKSFPQAQVEDFKTGEKFDIYNILNGKRSLVNVWASWCVTCRAEHEELIRIAKESGVQVIGINYKDTRANAKRFLVELGNPYSKIIFDSKGQLGLDLGVYATPESFLVDESGTIIYKQLGQLTRDIWMKEMITLFEKEKRI